MRERCDPTLRRVLFLCTGNYFRSRLAERLFNALARERGLACAASSRSLAPTPERRNPGPISEHALAHLARLGLPAEVDRGPLEVTASELEAATLIVALHEREHRPLLEARFPAFAGRVRYWRCPDIGEAPPEEGARVVEAAVRALLDGSEPAGSRDTA